MEGKLGAFLLGPLMALGSRASNTSNTSMASSVHDTVDCRFHGGGWALPMPLPLSGLEGDHCSARLLKSG